MITITDHDIATQVAASLGIHVGDFDVDGIVRDVIAQFGLVSIDDIDETEYWALVEEHAR